VKTALTRVRKREWRRILDTVLQVGVFITQRCCVMSNWRREIAQGIRFANFAI
jgi:hypothetical protein